MRLYLLARPANSCLVSLSMEELQHVTVTIQYQDAQLRRLTASPPLHVSLTGPGRDHYSLAWSWPIARGDYIAPSGVAVFQLPFRQPYKLYDPMPEPIGAIVFRCESRVELSFVIFWGLQYSLLGVAEPTYFPGKSWWDGSEPACFVLVQQDLPSAPQKLEDECASALGMLNLTDSKGRMEVSKAMHASGWPHAQSQELQIAGFWVRTSICRVEFLDRRSFSLVVEISSPNENMSFAYTSRE